MNHPPSDVPPAASTPPARIVVVEDFPVVRDGLVQLLGAAPGLTVVDAVGDERAARASLQRHRPDLLLLDLMLSGQNGLPFIADLNREQPALKILVLSMLDEAVFAERALRAGAVGYVMKTADTAEVLQAVRSVLDGRVYLSPRIFVTVFRGLLHRSSLSQVQGAEGLSDRELQIFQLIGSGAPNRQIATQLGISVKTVETHREHLKSKLGLHDSTALTHAAELFINSLTA
jgi:DNA-binding NarL/FixJ family response regulator